MSNAATAATVVLARKYRPRRFAEMVGQEHVVQALTNALLQNRLHHAYLFTGTRGIGKTTVSRILAKSLNCVGADGQGGVTAEPCGVCSACTEIDADRYIDYIELDAASNRGIDEIKDLIERAAYKPGVGRYKVFMIDEAHQLTKDAFNALLKTLEEPPEYLKFVLATTDPEKMLPTVLSRCLQFNLRPMAPSTVREHLARVLEAEAVPFDDGALRLLARAARGSMRDGLSLTDQAIAYGGGALREDAVCAMLGSVDRGQARALVEALARRDGPAVLQAVDGLRALALSASGTLEEIARLLQGMAVEQAVPGALDTQDPETEDARTLASLLAPDETQLLYSMVLHGRGELSLMSDEYGALTMVLLRFLAFPPQGGTAPRVTAPAAPVAKAVPLRAPAPPAAKVVVPLPHPQQPPQQTQPPAAQARQVTASLAPTTAAQRAPEGSPPWEALEPGLEAGAGLRTPLLREPSTPSISIATPAAAASANAPRFAESPAAGAGGASLPPAAGSALGERWAALVQQLSTTGRVQALARELAMQAGLLSIDDQASPPRWTLQVERETLRAPALQEKLRLALAAELGHELQLELQPGTPADTPARREAAERQRRQQVAEAAIHADPLVQSLLAQVRSARIVPGSIRPVLNPSETPPTQGSTP